MSFIKNAFSGASNDFTANSAYAPGTQATVQNLQPAIATANTNYQGANSGFDALAQAVNARMSGQTPSLSGQMLSNATGANVANQAALMAGQRGASTNVGLMSRQIANQGAGIQQHAAGQAAAGQIAENQANIGALSGIYSTKGQLANQNLGIQQAAMQAQNSGIISDIQGRNNVGSEQAKQNAQMNQGLIGGATNFANQAAQMGMSSGGSGGGGSSLGMLAMAAQGGMMQKFATGGSPSSIAPGLSQANFGFNFANGHPPAQDPVITADQINQNTGNAGGGLSQWFNNVSGPAGNVAMAAKGGTVHLPFHPHDYRRGGNVVAQNPQQQATVPGNSYANDKIPAMVSEGEIVIPRDISMHPNAPQLAAKFVAQEIAKRGRK